ncbi:MAG TPA: HAMP domain-containing protein [Bacilli bacterium]|nr:HAMP domain-containing protein [Bacilli bacterium]
MKSLRFKLLLVVLPILTIALSLVAFINHNKAKEFLEDEFSQKTAISLENATNFINNYFEKRISQAEVIAHTETVRSMERERFVPFLAQEFERTADFEMLLVSDLQGNAISHEGTEANVQSRTYFIQALETGKMAVSEPIVSKATGVTVVAIGVPIHNGERNVGVLIGTVPIDEMVNLVSNFKIGDHGYAFLVNRLGQIIAHPDKQVIEDEVNIYNSNNEDLKEIVSASFEGETGSRKYNDKGVDSYAYFGQIPSTTWGFVISAPVKEVTKNLSFLAKLSFATAVVVLGFSSIIMVIFARRLVNPIKRLSEMTTIVAQGDLTVAQHTNEFSKDEVGVLGENFQIMVKRIQELLSRIEQVSKTVKHSSDAMLESSKETSQSAEQVAMTINELAIGTTDIANSVTNTTDQMNTMVETMNNIMNYTNEVIETAETSKKIADDGRHSADEAIKKMNEVNFSVDEAREMIHQLDRQAKEIGDIIDMITNIAEQTNLLALNASIEAARAGEQGKGFAVVADEVRKLASETSESAEKIARLIHGTQEGSSLAVQAIEKGSEVVDEGMVTVQEAGAAFVEIVSHVENVLVKNKHIHEAVSQLEQIGQGIGRDMESISAITEQASAGAEEVSATSHEQANSARNIAEDSYKLAQIAEELSELMKQFKIR